MSKKLIYSILLIAVFAGSAQAQFITSIVHRNGGAPEQPEIAPNPLDEDELTFVDRTHQYNDIPESILGAQYVKLANDDKGISAYELDVTMAANATLYVFVDNRMGSSDGGMGVDPDITGMSWLTDMGFEDTGDDIGIDESGDGDIDQYSSVFSMPVLGGTTITLHGNTEGHGGNMYGVAALGPKFKASNPVPADGALYEGTWVNLGWSPGDTAVSHDVYLGENFDDVNDGTPDSSGFRGNQPLTSTTLFIGFLGYPYPDGLVPGTTYYWRIDEVEADGTTIYKGNVWSFTIPSKIAYNPNPADGARYVDPNVELNWTAGLGTEVHYVYFGDNFDDVNSAVEGLLLVDTTYTPGTLEVDKTYYWRVDESDFFTMQKGDVWSFSTVPDIPITDPNLLCWWKFDEGSGTTAVDYSGHNNHGTLMDDPQWVDGQVGGALEFGGDGDHVVDEDAENYLNGLNALTVCIWVKSDVTGTNKGFIICEQPDGSDSVITMRYDSAGANGGGTDVLKMALTSTEDEQQLESSNNAQTTEWQHYSMVWSSGQQLEFYINGVLDVPMDNQPATTGTITDCSVLIVGMGGKFNDTGVGGWDGLIDGIRIYNKVLTADDITQVMRGEPDLAWNPKPANGSTLYIGDATPLSWSAGENASQHDVYFGIDKDVVADANTSTTDIYRGRQFGTSYTPPDVEWGGGPYYWRIDEYNTDATISEGRIWNFTVADFIGIEDFEDYNDFEPDRIFDVWLDGWGVDTNGSEVGYADPDFDAGEHHIETNIVHGGEQSMPYFYDTNFKFSEAKLPLSSRRNWTEEGVGVLSLWFRGNPAGLLEGPAGTYTMTGAGADIWGTADEFRYAWKQLSGDGSIVAQVLSVENTDPWAKVGVMIRNTLDADSANAMAYITPDGRVGWQYRVTAGDSSSSTRSEPGAITTPHWLKLTRQGNTITAQHSSDGVNWEDMVEAANPQEPSFTSILMNQSVYIGLALTSHSSGVTCVAEFSDVETTGAVSPPTWTHEAIGATMVANDPARMYVALNGGTAVYHVNPNAALIDTWTEWPIDLQAFTGVGLTNVNTLAIGFGDKNNLQAGGTGLVFFDDIRLYRPAEPQP